MQCPSFSKVTYDFRIQISDLLQNAVYFDSIVHVTVRRGGLSQLLKEPDHIGHSRFAAEVGRPRSVVEGRRPPVARTH